MPLIFDQHNNCSLFIHIPKTGGSSVEIALRNLSFTLRLIENGLHINENFPFKSTPQHFTYSTLIEILEMEKIRAKATVVRHPFTRFISEFYWLRKNNICNDPTLFINELLNKGLETKLNIDGHLNYQYKFIGHDVEVFKLEQNGVSDCINFLANSLHIQQRLVDKFSINRVRKKSSPRDHKRYHEIFMKYKTDIENFYNIDMKMFGYVDI